MEKENIYQKAKEVARKMVELEDTYVIDILNKVADAAIQNIPYLLEENLKDLLRMDENDPKYDRLRLTEDRIKGIAEDIRNVAQLNSPLGEIIEEKTLKNGLNLKKIRVPLGVVGIIYEARPNVTFDVFALCLKSGNVSMLKGGSDADFSNRAILKVINSVLENFNISANIVQLLPPSREATSEMLNAVDYIDIIIPRGSQKLINYVRENSRVPVIETGAGIVHTYYHASADKNKGKAIISNAKLRRVSVCNALDCLIIDHSKLDDLIFLVDDLKAAQVEIFADEPSFAILKDQYHGSILFRAEEEHFGTEFLAKKLAIKTVSSEEEALDHIARYSSRHSEAIIAEDAEIIDRFLKMVDAATVYANTSTAFTDGSQFEMGAEIGISTQKLHARGPMSLPELTSYKWIVIGDGQIREN